MDTARFQYGPSIYQVSVDLGDNVEIARVDLGAHRTVCKGATFDGEVIHDAPANVDESLLVAAERALAYS
tara:strand:- start:6743 stop:6952 length:210 start_codon:yes stop_codon:yes gene_type:complete